MQLLLDSVFRWHAIAHPRTSLAWQCRPPVYVTFWNTPLQAQDGLLPAIWEHVARIRLSNAFAVPGRLAWSFILLLRKSVASSSWRTEAAIGPLGPGQMFETRRHDVAQQVSLAIGTFRRWRLEEAEARLLEFSAWHWHVTWRCKLCCFFLLRTWPCLCRCRHVSLVDCHRRIYTWLPYDSPKMLVTLATLLVFRWFFLVFDCFLATSPYQTVGYPMVHWTRRPGDMPWFLPIQEVVHWTAEQPLSWADASFISGITRSITSFLPGTLHVNMLILGYLRSCYQYVCWY